MKTFVKIMLCVCISVYMAGCDGIDKYYKGYLEGGPILYIGKVDSVKVFAGHERLMLQWLKRQDPRAQKAIVSWANGTQQIEVDLTPKDPNERYVQTIISSLSPGLYTFKIVTYDNKGNSSIPVEALGNVYGDDFGEYLKVRPHISFDPETGLLRFKKNTADRSFVETEITYYKIGESEPVTVTLGKSETDIVLVDYDSTHEIAYRGVHQPEENSIDYYYSEYLVIPAVDIP